MKIRDNQNNKVMSETYKLYSCIHDFFSYIYICLWLFIIWSLSVQFPFIIRWWMMMIRIMIPITRQTLGHESDFDLWTRIIKKHDYDTWERHNIFGRMVRFRWRLHHLSTSYIVLYNWLDQARGHGMEMLWSGVGYNKGDPA